MKLEKILNVYVDPSAKAKLEADWNVIPLVAGLVGKGCEATSRNRGSDIQVAPMLLLDSGLWAWIGYHEEWDAENPAGVTRRFSFRSVCLTVYFGYLNVLYKPQMFRAEWAGWARWNQTDFSYQAGNAAHPHWQFDALESLKRDEVEKRAAVSMAVLRSEAQEAPASYRQFLVMA